MAGIGSGNLQWLLFLRKRVLCTCRDLRDKVVSCCSVLITALMWCRIEPFVIVIWTYGIISVILKSHFGLILGTKCVNLIILDPKGREIKG